MSHDPSDLFRELAKSFSRRQPEEAPSRDKTSPSRRSVPQEDDTDGDSDAALFLRAVSAVRPSRGTARSAAKPPPRETPPATMASRGQQATASPRASQAAAKPSGKPAHPVRSMTALPGAAQEPEAFAVAASREEDLLFAKAMQGVDALNKRGRDVPLPAGKSKTAPAADPAKALRDLLEGRLEFALSYSDEFVEGCVVGVDPLILTRLRAGQFSPEAHLDLHGQNAPQARDSLTWFIKNAYQRGLRTVLVITGRGKNSPDGIGVLRPLLQRWLPKDPFKRVVLAFCTAKASDGGPGAIYVLLRKYRKNRGKILWEHGPAEVDDDF